MQTYKEYGDTKSSSSRIDSGLPVDRYPVSAVSVSYTAIIVLGVGRFRSSAATWAWSCRRADNIMPESVELPDSAGFGDGRAQ